MVTRASRVADIIRTARNFNSIHAITGILIFDGDRFCQVIEGPTAPMAHLIDRLQGDRRDTEVTILLQESTSDSCMFPHWNMAYAPLDGEPDHLCIMAGIRGTDALTYLQNLTPLLDIG
jgi:hypothetical protein